MKSIALQAVCRVAQHKPPDAGAYFACRHSELHKLQALEKTTQRSGVGIVFEVSHRMISQSFNEPEHRELDRALAEVEFLAEKRTFLPAAKRLDEFRKALTEHLTEEETVILPEFERHTGDPQRVVPLIRSQHAQLESVLNQTSAALRDSNFTEFCNSIGVLDRLLKEHQATEERLIPQLSPKRSA